MRLLIDTQALLWFVEGNGALSGIARAAMEDAANERYVSHATAWEVAIKVALGKLKITVGYETLFPGVLAANGFVLLPSAVEHYQALIPLPRHHGDPFDRLIIAQAQVEGLTVVTSDGAFPAYGVSLLWQSPKEGTYSIMINSESQVPNGTDKKTRVIFPSNTFQITVAAKPGK